MVVLLLLLFPQGVVVVIVGVTLMLVMVFTVSKLTDRFGSHAVTIK